MVESTVVTLPPRSVAATRRRTLTAFFGVPTALLDGLTLRTLLDAEVGKLL